MSRCTSRFIKEKLRDPKEDARQNCGKDEGHKGMHRNLDRDLYWQRGAEISIREILDRAEAGEFNDPEKGIFPGIEIPGNGRQDLWGNCGCWTCVSERVTAQGTPFAMPFIVCPECGNKRCPKAMHHDNECSGSNEPGQPGSRFEHVPPFGDEETPDV